MYIQVVDGCREAREQHVSTTYRWCVTNHNWKLQAVRYIAMPIICDHVVHKVNGISQGVYAWTHACTCTSSDTNACRHTWNDSIQYKVQMTTHGRPPTPHRCNGIAHNITSTSIHTTIHQQWIEHITIDVKQLHAVWHT